MFFTKQYALKILILLEWGVLLHCQKREESEKKVLKYAPFKSIIMLFNIRQNSFAKILDKTQFHNICS